MTLQNLVSFQFLWDLIQNSDFVFLSVAWTVAFNFPFKQGTNIAENYYSLIKKLVKPVGQLFR